MDLFLYNSLTRNSEKFIPITEGEVTMYACGPTVYNTAHVGNFRTFTLADIVFRVLTKNGYKTTLVMNITDVGHLVSDADEGEDKMAKGAEREGLNMWELAAKYTLEFLEHSELLNLVAPNVLPRATGHIQEQIALIKVLEEKGFTYVTHDGVYFDTAKFEAYGQLSDLETIEEGKRVEKNAEKKNPTDFALWKFHMGEGKREMEWESPWGTGFPGWHIECSAMSLKYLGDAYNGTVFLPEKSKTIDLHLGGVEHKQIHHPNEIAQTEAATGRMFVKYWLHGEHLMIDNAKISKSLGNVVLVSDLVKRGFSPLALRLLYFSAHYRKQLNFTWDGMNAAQAALMKLYAFVSKDTLTPGLVLDRWVADFMQAVNDDFNMPQAIAVMWNMLKSEDNNADKLATLFSFDEVLGLQLCEVWTNSRNLPDEIRQMVSEREHHRQEKMYDKADSIRDQLTEKGYDINDTPEGAVLIRRSA